MIDGTLPLVARTTGHVGLEDRNPVQVHPGFLEARRPHENDTGNPKRHRHVTRASVVADYRRGSAKGRLEGTEIKSSGKISRGR